MCSTLPTALYRLGLAANLTLGNKKGIDIVVACDPGRAFTIEVKAVAGKNDWLVGQLGLTPKQHHFVVLVCYEGVFEDPDVPPNIWVFRHDEIIPFIRSSKTGTARYISCKQIRGQLGRILRTGNYYAKLRSNSAFNRQRADATMGAPLGIRGR